MKYTLECGQCFRWECTENNTYVGVIEDRVIKIKQEENKILVWSSLVDNLEEVVCEYFDLNKDYVSLEKDIAKIDKNVEESLKYSSGIRILNQPLFETIISYIISANNEYYLFTTLEEIKNITMDDLLECGTGFRARYIKNVINYFIDNNEFLTNLKEMDTENARKSLMSLMGVGPKVADCILLFSLKRGEVFPIDVWVKRIMEKLYFKDNTSIKEISEFAKDKFGKHAGIIQQHLFHNVREGNI